MNLMITFVRGSQEINSFVDDSRQLKIGIHSSRKTPFLTLNEKDVCIKTRSPSASHLLED